MAKPLRSLRLSPRTNYERFTGVRGEIFYDPVNDTLRVFDSETQGGSVLATRTWVNTASTVNYNNLTNKPALATVATTGSYTDLINRPETSQWKISADDSTVLTVPADESVSFRGQGMITTTVSNDSTGVQMIITAPELTQFIDVNQALGSETLIPSEFAAKGYADLLFNLQTAQLQNGTLDTTLNSVQFNSGVPIAEFSNDITFVDNSTSAVPTESAIRGYIDRRLGFNADGDPVQPVNKIGPNYLTAGVLSGQVVSMHCERQSTGAIGQIMSFGNGSSAGKGLRMPRAGKLILATLAGTGIDGTLTVQAYLNGSANASYQLTQTNGTAADVGVTGDFFNAPLTFNAGDTLGWYQASLPTAASTFNVNFYVTFD
jgi:hypothetical protein